MDRDDGGVAGRRDSGRKAGSGPREAGAGRLAGAGWVGVPRREGLFLQAKYSLRLASLSRQRSWELGGGGWV